MSTIATPGIKIPNIDLDNPVSRIQLFPLDQWIRGQRYNKQTKEFYDQDIHLTAEFLASLITATRDVRDDNPITIYTDHEYKGKAYGQLDVTTLGVESDGLYGTVRWTAAAVATINAGEWRYISPGFFAPNDFVDPRTNERVSAAVLKEISITNDPHFVSQQSLAASAGQYHHRCQAVFIDNPAPQSASAADKQTPVGAVREPPSQTAKENMMNPEEFAALLAKLGLSEGATFDDVMEALNKLTAEPEPAQAAEGDDPDEGKPVSASATQNPIPASTSADPAIGSDVAAIMVANAVAAGNLAPKDEEGHKVIATAIAALPLVGAQALLTALQPVTANADSLRNQAQTPTKQPLADCPSSLLRANHLNLDGSYKG